MQKLILEPDTKDLLKRHIQAKRMVVPEPHKMDLSNGCIVVSCADGDQIVHVVEQVAMMATVQSCKPRPHLLTAHGGALILSPEWPDDVGRDRAKSLLLEIAEARELKGISTILLLSHAPCGKVVQTGMGVEETIKHLMLAKKYVKGLHPTAMVRCLKQVDWQEQLPNQPEKEMYFLPVERWPQFPNIPAL